MTAYIKISTLEYPRYPGDIAVDPTGDYAEVLWVDPPSYDPRLQICAEGTPVFGGGVWRMTWIVRDATSEEVAEYDIVLLGGAAINRPEEQPQ